MCVVTLAKKFRTHLQNENSSLKFLSSLAALVLWGRRRLNQNEMTGCIVTDLSAHRSHRLLAAVLWFLKNIENSDSMPRTLVMPTSRAAARIERVLGSYDP